jgi:NTE family protein
MTKRALILGGGGTIGVAWETAILAGLLDCGLDAREADIVVGTSAGSVVGSWIAQGRDPRSRSRERAQSAEQPRSPAPRDPAVVGEVFRLWSSFDEMTPERCAQIGALALRAPTVSQEDWLNGFIDDGSGWSGTRLLICAVDCESGELRTFTKGDGIPINVACAASCAVPGLFPTVEIDGRRYTDGGVRSWTSADVVLADKPDRVLIVAPAGVEGAPGVFGLAARQVQQEMQLLSAAGAVTRLITLDERAQQAGLNWMDPAGVPAVVEAAALHAARIGPELATWWNAEA